MRDRRYNTTVVRRKRRVRAHIARGTADCPRISVFRSSNHMHVQFIDDIAGKTLVSTSSLQTKAKDKRADINVCKDVGALAAKLAKEKGIARGIFDRGPYRFHGRVKALVLGLREGGIVV